MPSYQQEGQQPDFRVSYRLFTQEEGGRWAPPYQHIRWNFRYDDKTISTGTFIMVYPEILTPDGTYFPEGQPIPMVGLADMFIFSAKARAFHAPHIRPGTRGYFVEGRQRVGVWEVLEVTGLRDNLQV
jgi:hypothetical protein